MKKYIFLVLSLFLIFTGCQSSTENKESNGGTSSEATKDNQGGKGEAIKTYLPMNENVIYEYEGEGNELLSHNIINSYMKDNKVQRTMVSSKTITDYVLNFEEDKAVMYFSELNNYFLESYLDAEPNSEVVVLQEPLEMGAKWSPEPECVSEITSMDAEIEVPAGTYKTMEVTTTYPSGHVVKDYYAKEVGLVKTIQSKEGEATLTTSLKNLHKDASEKILFTVYYPDIDTQQFEQHDLTANFKTNDNGIQIFEDLLKTEVSGEGTSLISKTTKINDIKVIITEDEKKILLDLSSDYIKDMNAGAGFESMLLQGLTDTLCGYTNTTKLKLTIDGSNYSSGHIELGDDDYFEITKNESQENSDEENIIEVVPELGEEPDEVPAA